MSFSDLMSSGRGPGVIGLMVALLILLGFGGLFFLVFDEEMQGTGVSIESVISDQQKDIDDYHHQLIANTKALEVMPKLRETQSKFDTVARENRVRALEIADMREAVIKLAESLPAVQLELEKYKDEYRGFVRSKAVGEQIDELVCRSGTSYKGVEIREVTPVGVQIRHNDGQKRIPFEDLTDSWHERFQFDPLQKEKAIALEEAMRKQHEAAVEIAQQTHNQQQQEAQERQKIERLERAETAIAAKQSRIRQLHKDIQTLKRSKVGTKGSSSLSRPGDFKAEIQAKEAAIRTLENEISSLKSQR